MAIQRCCLLACAAALASVLPAQGPDGQGSEKGTRPAIVIGVVDLDKAIDGYAVAVAELDRLNKLRDQFSDELNNLTKAIDEMRGQLAVLRPGSLDHDAMDLQLRLAMNEREGRAQLRTKQFERQRELFELEVYQDIEFAIARVAETRGVAVVMRAQSMLDLASEIGDDPVAVQRAKHVRYTRRTVWYTSPEVDLTPYLIKYLQVFDPRAERKKAAEAAAKKTPAKTPASRPKDGK